MVTNNHDFTRKNPLLDPVNPRALPYDTLFYGDLNSGWWQQKAIEKECTDPIHILIPFCHFIDGLAVSKYDNINVEAILTCCVWFNRNAHNRSSTWWI